MNTYTVDFAPRAKTCGCLIRVEGVHALSADDAIHRAAQLERIRIADYKPRVFVQRQEKEAA